MPYGLVLLIAAPVLAFRYATCKEASSRSKRLVVGLIVASFLVVEYLPAWYLAATLLQLAVSIYVLLYLKVTAEAG
jgi:hypothetical protein